ncbi:hypothetical protein CPB83DRAFT_852857 [Crepidotus variabilis]|uniref:Uncharacterized protein n=1 Tax=Crepidotus variabilis TaxID=179855 RepID=A0A9P6EHK8_9AGAR|nr:hypothetical protein CPB83DRAFT_852857 [Crepidotus variabilis]
MTISDFASQIAQISPLSIPGLLWAWYLEYLWNYEGNSWVARTAYTFRVLAVLICLPFVIFGLLDIASYIVARTLGVVDVVKASTSDKATVHGTTDAPQVQIQIQDDSSTTSLENSLYSQSDRNSGIDHNIHNLSQSSLASSSHGNGSSFYGENGNLRLAGVGVFSPMASQPPSPTLSRQQLSPEVKEQLRHRTHQIPVQVE